MPDRDDLAGRIESFDVEPVRSTRLPRWLLGGLATLTGVLAVIGWPILVLPGRYTDNHAWAQNSRLIGEWLAHDGWRTSASSWFWGGVAIVATTWAVELGVRRGRDLRWVLVLLPGTVIGALGPLAQTLLGVRWANYSSGHHGLRTAIAYAVGILVAAGLPFLRGWVMHGREEPQVAPFDRR